MTYPPKHTSWQPCQSFNYSQLAREAARERDTLKEILRQRREKGPQSPGDMMAWNRDNTILYAMYLEQRSSCQEMERRACRR